MELQFQQQQHIPLLENYILTDDQLKNTMHPIDCVSLAKEDESRHNIVALEDGKCIAFFVLHSYEGVKPYNENPNSILLRAFSVQHALMGQGIGTKILAKLPVFVAQHFPTVNEITLCVNCKNERAIHLYEKMHYKRAQGIVEGRQGPMYVMHCAL